MDKKYFNAEVSYGAYYIMTKEGMFLFSDYNMAEKAYNTIEGNSPKGIFVFVTYGNLSPTLIGKDTNVSPFKGEYQALKDAVRSSVNPEISAAFEVQRSMQFMSDSTMSDPEREARKVLRKLLESHSEDVFDRHGNPMKALAITQVMKMFLGDSPVLELQKEIQGFSPKKDKS